MNSSFNLIRKESPWCIIEFIHFKDKKKHVFYSCINDMSGDRLSAFDNDPPSVNDELKWVKSVLRDIKNKAIEVISYEGTIKFEK